jgi:hypothetical protein
MARPQRRRRSIPFEASCPLHRGSQTPLKAASCTWERLSCSKGASRWGASYTTSNFPL